ncbi:MAG TPA: DUF4260 family protein [Anaerolineales bacterium]
MAYFLVFFTGSPTEKNALSTELSTGDAMKNLFDRVLGYGLKHKEVFQNTNLGRIGR